MKKNNILLFVICAFLLNGCRTDAEIAFDEAFDSKYIEALMKIKVKFKGDEVVNLIDEKRVEIEKWYDNQEAELFTDVRDGKEYKTILLRDGNTWLAQNLNFETEESYCYNDDNNYCESHGRLYSWEKALIACPENWHLPSDDEWWRMLSYYGSANQNFFLSDRESRLDESTGRESYEYLIKRGKTKFAANLGGGRGPNVALSSWFSKSAPKYAYDSMNKKGLYWTSTKLHNDDVIYYDFSGRLKEISQGDVNPESFAHSCRCIKDK